MNARERHLEKMKELEIEMNDSGCIHKMDIQKELKRMRTQLMEYDRWHRQAEAKV